MSDLAHESVSEPMGDSLHEAGAPLDVRAQIASLQAAGAGCFDRARMHYIETLASRADAQRGSTRDMLDARLAQAVAALQERFDRALGEARDAAADATQRHPQSVKELQRLLDIGDFRGVRRLIGSLQAVEQRASLASLVRQLEDLPHETVEPPASSGPLAKPAHNPVSAPGTRTELKTLRNFRKTWATLSVDKQVSQAMEQAPRNAGPINSHMLVVRSLASMRDISPDYLNRFMTYVDTLLRLDQGAKAGKAEKEKPVSGKKGQAAKAAKKTTAK